MIDDPFGLFAEEGGGGVQVDGGAFDQSLVPLGRVFAGGVAEEAAAEGLADFLGGAAAGDDGVFVAVHDLDELVADVFGAAHGAGLDEVLEAPGVGELVLFPAVVDV